MRRYEIFPAPCIWAKSEFLEVPCSSYSSGNTLQTILLGWYHARRLEKCCLEKPAQARIDPYFTTNLHFSESSFYLCQSSHWIRLASPSGTSRCSITPIFSSMRANASG